MIMRKRSIVSIACVFAVFVTGFSTTVCAAVSTELPDNASFGRYLPVMIAGAFIVESLIVMFLSRNKRIVNVSFAVLVANVASFLIPRIAWGLMHGEVIYRGMFISGDIVKNWLTAGVFLIISLIIELPVILFMLRHFTEKKAGLVWSCIAANVITSVILAIVQQVIYNSLIS